MHCESNWLYQQVIRCESNLTVFLYDWAVLLPYFLKNSTEIGSRTGMVQHGLQDYSAVIGRSPLEKKQSCKQFDR
jgi:hypothetical protein